MTISNDIIEQLSAAGFMPVATADFEKMAKAEQAAEAIKREKKALTVKLRQAEAGLQDERAARVLLFQTLDAAMQSMPPRKQGELRQLLSAAYLARASTTSAQFGAWFNAEAENAFSHKQVALPMCGLNQG